MSKPKSAHNLYPPNGGRRSNKKRGKSGKQAASRARGVATKQVVTPESKRVIGVKVRSPASGQVAGFPKVFPGKVIRVAGAKKRATRDQNMMKSRRGYKWISYLDLFITVTMLSSPTK
jgi:hypothetical protein